MTANEIRARFLEFFAQRDHEVVPSSTLIPHDDPTLLFTNAGMNQFKAVLLGEEKRSYVRAASSQKCMRVSGKHNDLEAVGRDGRHHTFFEMLGNWSFGDYYKRDAIAWAWEFLTQEMGLDQEKLLVSVYKDDDESYNLWRDGIGVPEDRIYRLGDLEKGDDENFWSMGDTGPCGPCTEIHYDQGPEVAQGDDRPLGENDSDRYLEIWNLVFIQYDRDDQGTLTPLPMQSVDTGMGLERIAALKAGVTSNYGTDLFTPITDWVARESGASLDDPENRISAQVIADHARALCFAVADGGRPGNDGRGYVLRRILRRAARHGRRLGFTEPFLYRAAEVVIGLLHGHYRELDDARDHILRTIRVEEERFNETLDRGLAKFAEFAEQAKRGGDGRIGGEQAFQLHDTYGFPLDLTQVMAEEEGLGVDEAGFDAAMQEQKDRARAAGKFRANDKAEPWTWFAGEPGADRDPSEFVGYDTLETEARLTGIRHVGDGRWEVMLDRTPFYAESGGQVGDVGTLRGEGLRLRVVDTQSGSGGPVHTVEVEEGALDTDGLEAIPLTARVDGEARLATMRNHTATHLLHAELKRQLGDHATQAGSLVNPEKLRFDFHHDGALGRELLGRIESALNAQILADAEVAKHVDIPLERAREMGAVSMFGEKYGDTVRVVEVPGLSMEFCGGTHLDHVGQIGMLRITGESAVGAGVRRIEAVTGQAAVAAAGEEHRRLGDLAERLSAKPDQVVDRVESLQAEIKQLKKQLTEARKVQSGSAVDDILAASREVAGIKVVAHRFDTDDRGALMQMGDTLREKLGSGVAVLGGEVAGKVAFLVVVTDDLIQQRNLKAGDIVKGVSAVAGGSGGGRPHMAQAGGSDPARIDDALQAAASVVEELA